MSGRKILHPLQPMANNQQLLVGSKGCRPIRQLIKDNVDNKLNENANELKDSIDTNVIRKHKKSRSVKNENQENSDKKPAFSMKQPNDGIKTKQAANHNEETIKEEEIDNADSEIISWMTSDVAPEGYWKKLAEERRLALEETLEENERLHKALEVYKKENSKLQRAMDELLGEMSEFINSQKDDSGFIQD